MRIRVLALLGALLAPTLATADGPTGAIAATPEGADILKAMNQRDRGKDLLWDVSMDLIDRSGEVRPRTGKIYRRGLDNGRNEQITVFFSPPNIRHTALLDIEAEDNTDYMWLYLPALKATKRVPPAERGEKFVGTDFTNEDVNLGFEHEDYVAAVLERTAEDGHPVAVMRIDPKTDDLKRDLGFDTSLCKVRTDQAFMIDQRLFKGGREIRHNQVLDIRPINGILTPAELRSQDLVNDHRTVLKVLSATYNSGLPANLFTQEALAREAYR
jgi:hypothetical protein